MRLIFRSILPVMIAATATLGACKKSGGDSDSSSTDEEGAGKLKIKTKVVKAKSAGTSLALSTGGATGASASADLDSLKYYITSIKICEDMEVNGTGYSNPKNCIMLFQQSEKGYEDYGADDARNDDEHYIDLMDSEDIAKLATSTTVSKENIGKYKYGLVNWFQPIKVKATMTLDNSTTLYTHDGTVAEDEFGNIKTSISNITTGPAEEAIVQHNNGGAWFRFQTPFEITKEDIASGKAFLLDLIFNPDRIVKGCAQAIGCSGNLVDSTNSYEMNVPMLGLTPVFHREDQKVLREAYYFTNSGTNGFEIRLDLYYLDGDSKKTIYGVEDKIFYNETSGNSTPSTLYSFFSVTSNDDGSLDFNDWQGAVISGFKRLSDVGDTDTATICEDMASDGCSEMDISYELISDGSYK